MEELQFDLMVIGGGPGGYTAAIRAAQEGLRVCVAEQGELGGVCLNRGCIPTKNLLASSARYASLEQLGTLGIRTCGAALDFKEMILHKERAVAKLRQGVAFLMKKNRIRVETGTAYFQDENSVCVESPGECRVVRADHFLVATGSRPCFPDLFCYDGKQICGSDEALGWNERPDSLLVVGGGAVGCEMACIYANLGTRVTLVEQQDRLVPTMESELGKFVQDSLEKMGVTVLCGAGIREVLKQGRVKTTLTDGTLVETERVLVGIGRKADLRAVEKLGPALVTERGKIKVNEHMRSSVPHIYAVGDVCGTPYDLAHTAMHEAQIAVDNMLGRKKSIDYSAVPVCVYTQPEIASVGYTRLQAEEQGHDVMTGEFAFSGNGRAIASNEANGWVRLVADRTTGYLLGAQIAGAHATELIAQLTLAVENMLTVYQVIHTVFAHPTLSEAVWEAACDMFGQAIHK